MDRPFDEQNVWHIVFSFFFLAVLAAATWLLLSLGRMPYELSVFDLILVILATFRVTRLFVYDKITQWIHDLFLHKEVVEGSPGEEIILRHKIASGPRRTIHELISCPWCFGIWAAFVVTFFYFLWPEVMFYPILLLAISGVGTFLQISANLVGHTAEQKKMENERF